MSKSVFAQLLEEAQAILHQRQRRTISLHFDWSGAADAEAWKAWADDGTTNVYRGESGEQALRKLVEALRGG